jgi:NADH-quinone oxidoreductase subunit E
MLAHARGWTAPPPDVAGGPGGSSPQSDSADVDRERPDEPVKPEQISEPPHEPGKPIPGEAKPGTQEGRNK